MKHIVIIDDSQVVLTLYGGVFEAAGFRVSALQDSAAFDPAEIDAPDLVLIDINMPEFFGDDIADFFRDELGLEIPILLFSSISEAELDKRASRCGADGFISKNWGFERIADRVKEILGASGPQAMARILGKEIGQP